MSRYQDSSAARRKLRTELRAARERKGLTQQAVVADLEWSLSKLLRIEAGSISVSITDLRALIGLYDITDKQLIADLSEAARESRRPPWWHEYQDIIRPQFAQLLGYETSATDFYEFAMTLIPGPFQTEEYATAVMRAARYNVDEETLQRGLKLRLRRGEWLLDRPDVRRIVLLLDETTLQRPVGGPETMSQQLEHLLALSDRDTIDLEVIPVGLGEHESLGGSFKVLRFDDDENDVLYLTGLGGDALVRDDQNQVSEYLQRFERMRARALSGADARQRINDAAKSFVD